MPCYHCQNCDFHSDTPDALGAIADIHQRVEPGEPMPAGECPACGALVQIEADPESLLARARRAGLTFGDCILAFAQRNTERDKRLIQRAREKWVQEGELEIDDSTIVSGTDEPGDYVLAWVWVDGDVPDADD